MSPEPIRVVLADDHTVVRAGLKAVLKSVLDITVVGEAANGRDVVMLAQREKPDVIVMDLAMPELDGIAATREIVAAGLPSRVLMLSMHTEEECLVPVMEAGAAGFLVKADAHRDLAEAIRIVANGDCFVRPSAARILARKLSIAEPFAEEQRLYQSLSPRERAVLRLVALGFTSAEVGRQVYLSAKMVDAHKHRIRTLLKLTHRAHYVQFALKLGLLGETPSFSVAQPES
jgi:two-component system, NarL family, response regulator NreC